jgi:hypothetical protein
MATQSADGGVYFLASAISRSDPLEFFLCGFVKNEIYVLPMPKTLKDLTDRIRTATANTDQPLLQNVWHEVEYHPDMCRATNGAHTELSQGMKKKLFELRFTMV